MSSFALDSWLAALQAEACARRDVPLALSAHAAHVTRRAFVDLATPRPLTEHERRRVATYFSSVVRRRLLRGAESRRAASRAVLATVVQDLRSVGRDAASIAEELERHWAGAVPDDLLAEFTLALCG